MTSAKTFGRWKMKRLLPIVMAVTCTFLWSAMFIRVADRNIGIDKDWLFLYLCGIEAVHPELHKQQIDLVKNIVEVGGEDQAVYRATMRANYCNNYLFTSLSMYLAGKWQARFGVSPTQDYSAYIARVLWYGISVSGLVFGMFCLLMVFFVAEGSLRTTIFATIGLGAVCYLTLAPAATGWFLTQATPAPPARIVNWANVLGVSMYSWLNPGAPYSLYSVFPRCLCALSVLLAFVFRWSGRSGMAYWMPLLVSGLHQSTSLILLVVLVACDFVIRPQALTRFSILLPIGVNLLVIFLRERMFAILGFSPSAVLIGGAVLLGLIVAFALSPPLRVIVRASWSFIEAWRNRTVGLLPLPFADALVIFATWLGVILISYLASREDAWYRQIYFWSELSPRYVGMVQLIVFAGLLYPLIVMFESARPVLIRALTASIAVGMLAIGAYQLREELTNVERQAAGARIVERQGMEQPAYTGATGHTMRVETFWYYMLVRNALLGDRSLSPFFKKT